MMGIDEAGRGPVLGPMVYAAAFCAVSEREGLKAKEFADSKTLTEATRERLFSAIQNDPTMGFVSDQLSASFIAGQMLGREAVSLNLLANKSTFALIDSALASGVQLREVFVDTVGDADRYKEKLSQRFPGILFTVCPKADSLYPIVSAASIVAKVTRDRALRDFQAPESVPIGRAFGCGYPGDKDTKAWLVEHVDKVFGFPSLVRASWSTCTPILDERAVGVKWECDDAGGGGQQQTLSFGGANKAAAASSGMGRHSFFRARKLQRVHGGF
jgi:ribonuclease H2 subunit A